MKADPGAGVQLGDFDLKAKIKAGFVFNDFFHMAKDLVQLFDRYGDKLPQPWRVFLETAELFAQPVEEGASWHFLMCSSRMLLDAKALLQPSSGQAKGRTRV